jgi:hypothetical protein
MKKIGGLAALILGFLFSSCTKQTVIPGVEERTFTLKNASGAVAGSFSIFTGKDGASVISVELDEKSHHIGTTYSAILYTPSPETCYARLSDVNAVIGYGETTGVTEAASGRPVAATELYHKTGYQLRISSNQGLVAAGVIQ